MLHSEDPIVFNFSHYSNPTYDKVLDEGIKLQGSDRKMAIKKFAEARGVPLPREPYWGPRPLPGPEG